MTGNEQGELANVVLGFQGDDGKKAASGKCKEQGREMMWLSGRCCEIE